jgi:hypothetical protein
MFGGIGLGGARAAWAEYDFGNHSYCYGPYTLVAGKAKPVDLDKCGGAFGETGEEWRFIGDGLLLVGEYRQSCDPCVDEEGNAIEDRPAGTFYAVTTSLHKLTGPREGLTLLDVDAGRILASEDGALVVYAGDGRRVLRVAAAATTGGLTGSDIVGLSGTRLRVYDSKTGSLRLMRNLPPGSVLRDVDQGYAVYSAAGSIRLLRTRDGKDLLAIKGVKKLVGVDLEPAGLYYGHNSGAGEKPGRVTFVPFSRLP